MRRCINGHRGAFICTKRVYSPGRIDVDDGRGPAWRVSRLMQPLSDDLEATYRCATCGAEHTEAAPHRAFQLRIH